MAKIIGPLHSAEARGRVAGLIFNTWRGISYAKAFCAPAQPRTQRALDIRAKTIRLVRAWQALSGANRALWNNYATTHPLSDWTGNPKRLTGANWFVGLNLRILELYPDEVDTPPVVAAPDPPANLAVVGGAEELVITWTATAGNMIVAQVFLQGPHSAGVLGKIERAKLSSYTSGEGGTVTISSLLEGTYTVFVRMMSEDDGQVSAWVSGTDVVDPPV